MPEKRAFSDDNIPTKSEDYHGTVSCVRADVAAGSIHVELTFDEAIRFALFVQSCVLNLNRYNRSKKEGKEMGLALSIKKGTVAVIEKPIRPEEI